MKIELKAILVIQFFPKNKAEAVLRFQFTRQIKIHKQISHTKTYPPPTPTEYYPSPSCSVPPLPSHITL